jgi:hypothetical protein
MAEHHASLTVDAPVEQVEARPHPPPPPHLRMERGRA